MRLITLLEIDLRFQFKKVNNFALPLVEVYD